MVIVAQAYTTKAVAGQRLQLYRIAQVNGYHLVELYEARVLRQAQIVAKHDKHGL